MFGKMGDRSRSWVPEIAESEPTEGIRIAMSFRPMNTTHEDFGREVHGRGPSDRNFGFVFTAAFLFFGLWPLRHGRPIRLWCLVLGGAFFTITLVRPALLHGANRIWAQIGILLGKVVTPVVTGLLFYLVFTPSAAVLRWMGKDILRLNRDPGIKTYWIQRDAAEDLSNMSNQF